MSSPEPKPRSRGVLILLALTLGFFGSAVVIEIGGHIYAYLNPSYWGFFFKPDPVLGWTLVPNLRWTSTGTYWYAREFSVPIQVNSKGFRDLEREREKPEGVVRLALLGDSLVEAIQVPFHQTGGQVLETKLNAWAEGRERYEVLNFGISNHGIGQYLLMWEERASKYQPDYVFILVAALHMNRAISQQHKRLRVRPTFRLKNGNLVRVPPKDFDAFGERQERSIRTSLEGKRIGRSPHHFFIGSLITTRSGGYGSAMGQAKNPTAFKVKRKAFAFNLRIIEELGKEVRSRGGVLGVVDTFTYFNAAFDEESAKLRKFCIDKGLGYIPLSEYLSRATDQGINPRWKYDAHFNKAGNELFAESLYQWVTAQRQLEASDESGGD